ncbi:hypothetical protein D3C75_1221140 [compost metagenome]
MFFCLPQCQHDIRVTLQWTEYTNTDESRFIFNFAGTVLKTFLKIIPAIFGYRNVVQYSKSTACPCSCIIKCFIRSYLFI